jgi:hypothetical protein
MLAPVGVSFEMLGLDKKTSLQKDRDKQKGLKGRVRGRISGRGFRTPSRVLGVTATGTYETEDSPSMLHDHRPHEPGQLHQFITSTEGFAAANHTHITNQCLRQAASHLQGCVTGVTENLGEVCYWT